MSSDLDSVDEKIIQTLQKDSRKSFVEIASEIGLSESAVRRRVKNLIDNGIIKKFTIEMSARDKTSAITLISVNSTADTNVVSSKLMNLKGVEVIYDITGQYDIAAISYCPVISYITSTPLRFMSLEETTFVSAVELTDISVIALVLSLALISMVNFLIIPLSIRFFTRLLTADSDNPISLAISTNDLRESFCKVCIIFSSTESRSDDISPLLLFRKQLIHYFQCSSNSFFIYYKWR